jgi:hypothetical protein
MSQTPGDDKDPMALVNQLEQVLESAREVMRLKKEFESWPLERQIRVAKSMSPSDIQNMLEAGKAMGRYADWLGKLYLEKIEAERAANTPKMEH